MSRSRSGLIPPHVSLVDVIENHHGELRDEELQPGQKVVYFVRHGQSMANVARDSNHPDYYDAPLTDMGHGQAQSLQAAVKKWGVQTAYCSPLTRAIQTACIAFAEEECPIYAWPIITEFYPDMPECQGRNRKDLETSLPLSALARFKDVRLDGVSDEWWHVAGDRTGRLRTFFNWLAVCPERRVAIVCHWGFIHEALEVEAKCPLNLQIHNCCAIRTIWHTSATLPSPAVRLPAAERTYGVVALPSSGGSSPLARDLFTQLQTFAVRLGAHPKLSNLASMRYHRLPFIHLASLGHIPDLTKVSEVKNTLRTFLRQLHASGDSDSGAKRFHFSVREHPPVFKSAAGDHDASGRARVLYQIHSETLQQLAAEVVAYVRSHVAADGDGEGDAAPRQHQPTGRPEDSELDDACVQDWCKRHGGARLVLVDNTPVSNPYFRPQGRMDLEMVLGEAQGLPLVRELLLGPPSARSGGEADAGAHGEGAGVPFEELVTAMFEHMEWEACLVSLSHHVMHTEGVFAL